MTIRLLVICLLLPAAMVAQTEISNSPIWYEGSNVGIGTTDPSQLLDLNKSSAGAVGPTILMENNNGALHDASSIQFSDGDLRGQLKFSVDESPWGADLVYLSGASGTSEYFRITSSGNVGIGTSSPVEALQVAGAVKVTSNNLSQLANAGALDFFSGNVRLLSWGPNTSVVSHK